MAQVLRLTVLTGPHRNTKFCLRGTTQCTIGRAGECFVQLVGTERDQFISRWHCQLGLTGSTLTLKDLHSTLGTYLDGKRIASVALRLPSAERAETEETFQQGSLLTIGGTTLRLHVVDCPPKNLPEDMQNLVWQPGQCAMKNCPWSCG